MHHYYVKSEIHSLSLIWGKKGIVPFNEFILSWNGIRPQSGGYTISIAVKIEDWSDWFPYAYWGNNEQYGMNIECNEKSLRIYQDTLEILNGKFATGFRVKIEACHGACLNNLNTLHAFTGDLSNGINTFHSESYINASFQGINLPLPLISQKCLPHKRSRDLCSPTATTSVVNFLNNFHITNAVSFASLAHDTAFDIFGNWVLNTAQAAAILGKEWHCWVQRLNSFHEIHQQLMQKIPVIISLKGPLIGSASSYTQGHLIVVKGFDNEKKRVLCMDPAFSTDQETDTSYALDDFMQAWGRRGYIAYMFSHSSIHLNKRLSIQK